MIRRRGLLALAGLTVQAGWGREVPAQGHSQGVVRVSSPPGPTADMLEQVRQLAGARGLSVQVALRSDDQRASHDLETGALDAAAFDSGVAFADGLRRHPGRRVAAATTLTQPMALYSRRLSAPSQLRDGDDVVVPDNAADLARALVLLQNYGLIELRDDTGLHATLNDVVPTSHRPRIVTVPAARLHAALDLAPMVAMASADALHAGLLPGRDSIGTEDARAPFAGLLAVRRDRLDEPWVAALLAELHGEDMKRYLLARFGNSVGRPW